MRSFSYYHHHYCVNSYCLSRSRRPVPGNSLFLQLHVQGQSLIIPFMSLTHDIDMYTFSASGSITSFQVLGTFFPRLLFTWPSLSIPDDIVDECASLPKFLSLTYSQARILRAAVLLPTASLRPILYSRRPGIVSPVFVRIPAISIANSRGLNTDLRCSGAAQQTVVPYTRSSTIGHR